MMKKLTFVLALLMLCFAGFALAETEGELVPKYDEMVVDVGRSLLTRYASSTNALKAAGVTYEISDPSIATVNDQGYVRGVAQGKCTVTVISKLDPAIRTSIPVRVVQPLKKIELSFAGRTLGVGKTMQLGYTLVPEDATNQTVTFSSDREKIATVDENGLVTAHARGTVNIYVTGDDGDVRTRLKLTVQQMPEEIQFKQDEYMLSVGKKMKLRATVLPSNANSKKITWVSSDESIVRVDKSGNVQAVAPGDAVITAASEADPSVLGTTLVHSVMPAKSVRLEETLADLSLGETVQLHATVLPETATIRDVAYTVTNRTVCSVDENGLVTAIGNGITTVTATTIDGTEKKASMTVRVIVPVEGVHFHQKGVRVGVGDKAYAYAKFQPYCATLRGMCWTSSDPSVATVSGTDARARIEGHKWGSAVLTGISEDGGYSASIQIHAGALHEAVTVTAGSVVGGQPMVTLTNHSDMHITGVVFTVVDSNGQIQTASAAVDIAPGAVAENVPVPVSVRSAEVAVRAWETDGGFYTNDGAFKNSYRMSWGMQQWQRCK